MRKIALLIIALALATTSCHADNETNAAKPTTTKSTTNVTPDTPDTASVKAVLTTSLGDITLILYGDTPRHRDNFVKLVNQGFYNDVLFHRVIKNFMIQTGDPDSKGAPTGKHLGAGGPGYQIDAEIVYPRHFHKRGALAAARQADQVNPERKSSGSQFYIVTGQAYQTAEISTIEEQMAMGKMQEVFNQKVQAHMDEIRYMQRMGNQAGLQSLQNRLATETQTEVQSNMPRLTDEQRRAYTSVGGAPHLDGQYTVFGEIIDGMDVVEKIEKAATDSNDRPTSDIKIISAKIIKE